MTTNNTNSKKLGRDEVLDAEKMLDRFKPLKRFLEDNWGRLVLPLRRARSPEDIRSALSFSPACNIETQFLAACTGQLRAGSYKFWLGSLGQVRLSETAVNQRFIDHKLISEISAPCCNDLQGLRMPTVLYYVLCLMYVSGFESHSASFLFKSKTWTEIGVH